MLPYHGSLYVEAGLYASLSGYSRSKPVTRIPQCPSGLIFDSSFESGNLANAVEANNTEFHLFLSPDTQTNSHTQWFYFAVRNETVTGKVTFRVLNLGKRWSLFMKGLKPLVWNERTGWTREGEEVRYEVSQWTGTEGRKRYYQLSFTYTFEYPQDFVYFAHCYPYALSTLLHDLESFHNHKSFLRINTLCETDGHNTCPLLTITDDIASYPSWRSELSLIRMSAPGRKLCRLHTPVLPSLHTHKKAVILLGRVHPGETSSSLVLKGAIDFLCGYSRQAQLLRRYFIFRIIPMLNPDGVVHGNTRTTLLGVDLNRRWTNPSKLLHPTLYYTKRLIQTMSEEREIALVCDLHGHSTKKHVFMYGCQHDTSENPILFSRKNALIRLFPLLLSQNIDGFSYGRCRFTMENSRKATARQVIFREIGIDRCYTMEISLFGPKADHCSALNEADYELIGRKLCSQLLIFSNKSVFKRKVNEACERLKAKKEGKKRAESEENEADLLEMERNREDFGETEAVEDLEPFASQLNESYSSDASDEGTESSDYSENEDEIEEKIPEKEPVLPVIPIEVTANSSETTKKVDFFLSRSQSPLIKNKGNEGKRAISASCAQLKARSSRFLQSSKWRDRSEVKIRKEGKEVQVVVGKYFRNEQLRGPEIPHASVIIARSAGGYLSANPSHEPRSRLPPSHSSYFRLKRIRSTLNVGKMTIWRPESKGVFNQRWEEKRERIDLLLNSTVL